MGEPLRFIIGGSSGIMGRMSFSIMRIFYTWLLLAAGVLLSAHIVPGIDYRDGASLVAAVILLSLFNAVIKPILVLFTLPFIVLTLGIGLILINALLFLLAGAIVEGFEVAGFGSAFLGSLIISIVNFAANALLSGRIEIRRGGGRSPQSPEKRPRSRKNDVIDI